MKIQAFSKQIAPTVTSDQEQAEEEQAEEESDPNPNEVSSIYARAAALDLADRNPIVFIPGIMGSKLVDAASARSVWGDFSRFSADPKNAENRQLIALPMASGISLDRLVSTTEADGAVSVAQPSHLPMGVGVYRDILQTMGTRTGTSSGRHRPDYNQDDSFAAFEFGYDWRRSLDETARRLDAFLRTAAYFVQSVRHNSEPVKFDIVAHSMGGLVLRYYLRYGGQLLPCDGSLPRLTWAGCERVAHAMLMGTPNGGSAMAIDRLVSGLPTKRLVHIGFDPFIVGTMPALYQLLPRTRHKPVTGCGNSGGSPDLLDPEFWKFMEWGLASSDGDKYLCLQLQGVDSPAKRRAVALNHLAKCLLSAKTFHASLDMPARPPSPLEMHLVAGDAQRTPATVTATRGEKSIRITRHGAGDGTVLRSSALLDERVGGEWSQRLETPIEWTSISFSSANHMALTRDRVALNSVLFRLFEATKSQ